MRGSVVASLFVAVLVASSSGTAVADVSAGRPSKHRDLTYGYELCGSATLLPAATEEASPTAVRDAAFDPRGSGTLWLASPGTESLRAITLAGELTREIPYDELTEASGATGEVKSIAWVDPSMLAVVMGGNVLLMDVDSKEVRVLFSSPTLSHVAFERDTGKLLVVETAGAVGAMYELALDNATPVAVETSALAASLTSVLATQKVTGLHARGGAVFTLCRSCMSLIQGSVSGEVISSRRFGLSIPRQVDGVWMLPPPPEAFTFTPGGEYLAVISSDAVRYYCHAVDDATAPAVQALGSLPSISRNPGIRARQGRLPVVGNGAVDSSFSWLPAALRPISNSGSQPNAPNFSPIDANRVVTAVASPPPAAPSTSFSIDEWFANQNRQSFEYDLLVYQPNPPPIVWPLPGWLPPGSELLISSDASSSDAPSSSSSDDASDNDDVGSTVVCAVRTRPGETLKPAGEGSGWTQKHDDLRECVEECEAGDGYRFVVEAESGVCYCWTDGADYEWTPTDGGDRVYDISNC